MSRILVLCEYNNGELKKGTLELLTVARRSGQELHALLWGTQSENWEPLTSLTQKYGAQQTWVCADDQLKFYNPEAYSQALLMALSQIQPEIVLGTSNTMGRDLIPRVAAHLKTGAISDGQRIEISQNSLVVRRPVYAGKCSAEIEFLDSSIKFVLMRPNQLPIEPQESPAKTQIKTLELPPLNLKTVIKNVVQGTVGQVDLTEANVIVSGGRGMKGPEHFKLLEELAAVLGGTVGASRAVADAGWVPHSMQVGQTGKTVAPTLYIACGISGAIQHLAGMSGSKVIVAINKDPEAPIFKKSTYGLVGDLFEIVPKLTEEFRRALK